MKRFFFVAALLVPLHAAAQTYTLEDCRSLAVQNNIAAREARSAIPIADEKEHQAFAAYLPQVSGSVLGFWSPEPMLSLDLAELGLAQPGQEGSKLEYLQKGFTAGITLMQPIYSGGQITAGHKLSELGRSASRLQNLLTEQEVELTAERYYWQIVSITEKLHTVALADSTLRQLSRDVESAVGYGTRGRTDLLRVRLQLNTNEAARSSLKKGLRLSKRLLAQYIGVKADSLEVVTPEDLFSLPERPVLLSADGSVGGSLRARLLGMSVEESELSLKLEKSKLLPQMRVGAGYAFNNLFGGPNTGVMVFGMISIPISAWWGDRHGVKAKSIELQNARERLSDQEQLLCLEIQRLADEVDDAWRHLELASMSEEEARENLRISLDSYKFGVSTLTDLLDAQLQYRQSRNDYIDAYAALMLKQREYANMLK